MTHEMVAEIGIAPMTRRFSVCRSTTELLSVVARHSAALCSRPHQGRVIAGIRTGGKCLVSPIALTRRAGELSTPTGTEWCAYFDLHEDYF
jgi:hypothetical protein